MNFKLQNQSQEWITPEALLGKWCVFYFYPKDNTPGCTTEAIEFSNLLPEFQKLNCEVFGISPDSIESHCRFIDKKSLTVNLLSDPDHSFTESLGFWQLKKFMGKEYMGVVRSTILINPQGQVSFTWSPVKLKGHTQEVLEKLKELQ